MLVGVDDCVPVCVRVSAFEAVWLADPVAVIVCVTVGEAVPLGLRVGVDVTALEPV